MRTLIQTPSGATRGFIIEEANGKRIYNPSGKSLGYYNRLTDATYSNSGRMVGKGDQLVCLLEN